MISKQINQAGCPFLADFQSANPFQMMDQMTTASRRSSWILFMSAANVNSIGHLLIYRD